MEAAAFLPLSLKIDGRNVVVIGGGTVAARKIKVLLRYGAVITVVAPSFVDELEQWPDSRLQRIRRTYEAADLQGALLVLACTNDREVNRRIHGDAHSRGCLVNVSDDESLCDFTLPAIVDRGSIQVSIATGGRSPALARLLRETIERLVGDEYVVMQEIAGSLREAARAAIPEEQRRVAFFRELASETTVAAFRESSEAGRARVAELCSQYGVTVSDNASSGS
jgi:siroheme synthase-like protein